MCKPARCSGCLKPGVINITEFHLRMKGLLVLERDNGVVETNIRFYLNKSCYLNIESLRNNMHSLKFLVIKKDPLLGTLSQEEIINVKLEDFNIQRIQNAEL